MLALSSTLALAVGCSTKALDQGGSSDGSTGDATASSAGATGTGSAGSDSGTTGGDTSPTGSTTTSTTSGGNTDTNATSSATTGTTGATEGTAGTTATDGTAGTAGTDATDATDSSSGSDSGSSGTTGEPPDECFGLDKATCEATPGCYAFWAWPVLEMNGGFCTGESMFVECGPDPGGCGDAITFGCDENEDVLQFPDTCLPPSIEPCDFGEFPEPC